MAHNTLPPLELSEAARKQTSLPTPDAAQNFDHLFTFPAGDVRITAVYKGTPIVGMVVGQSFCVASSVWQKFLYPPWGPNSEKNEGKSNDENSGAGTGDVTATKELDFSEDDGGALLILLRIAHLQFCKVPPKLSTAELYQVALLCEQYDCHRLIQPWIQGWLQSISKSPKSLRLLYIAWAFGRDELFSLAAQTIVRHSEVIEDGRNLKFDESILVVRAKLIDDILKVPYDHLRQYLGRSTPRCKLGKSDCDAMLFGCLVLSLDRAGFWPEKTNADIYYSPSELYIRLAHVRLELLPGHDSCSSRVFVNPILGCLKEIPDPTLDCHRRHMERRAKELAFDKDE
ncbi:hypothetical protein BDZ45DRAFT_723714 [Acephala macrosclerotiorum]|nr:hypothetical protein BDZ45DRAFT_723714 [Acephala macrosclerotiorum]